MRAPRNRELADVLGYLRQSGQLGPAGADPIHRALRGSPLVESRQLPNLMAAYRPAIQVGQWQRWVGSRPSPFKINRRYPLCLVPRLRADREPRIPIDRLLLGRQLP